MQEKSETKVQWVCPKHGFVAGATFCFSFGEKLEQYDGRWCLLCMLDKLDELGVKRVMPMDLSPYTKTPPSGES